MIGILISLDSGQLGRTYCQATIVTDDLKAFERFHPFLLHLFENGFVAKEVERVSNRNISLIVKTDFSGMFLHLFFSDLETAVAGHARNEQLPRGLLCDGKVAGGEIDCQFFVRAVSRAGSATGPVLQLPEMDVENF